MSYILIVNGTADNINGERILRLHKSVGTENEYSILTSNPQFAIGIAHGRTFLEYYRRQTIGTSERPHAPRGLVVARQTVGPREPELPPRVLDNGENDIVLHPFTQSHIIKYRHLSSRIISRHATQSATEGTYPHILPAVAKECVDIGVDERTGLTVAESIETDVCRRPELRVDSHQTVDGTYPKPSRRVLYHVADLHIQSVAGVVGHAVKLIIKGDAVTIFHQQIESAIECSHPYMTVRVLISDVDIVATDA